MIKCRNHKEKTKNRSYYLKKIYKKGKEKIQDDFSLEKLLTEVREIKMCLKTEKILS